MLEYNQIYLQNCEDGLLKLDSESVSLIVTSPVYKDEDGFHFGKLSSIFSELYRVLKNDSLFFLNFGHLANHKSRPFQVLNSAMCRGFQVNDTITWVKNHYKPIQGNKRLNNLTEFIFLLYKGKMPILDRLSIGVPYKDKSNVNRFAGGKDLKCRGNVWEIPYETINSKEQKQHNDRFPVLLPEMCIKLSGIKDEDIVLDPFSGSGTTCLAAKNLGKRYIGFEINENHYKNSLERLK